MSASQDSNAHNKNHKRSKSVRKKKKSSSRKKRDQSGRKKQGPKCVNWCFTDFELLTYNEIFEAHSDRVRYIGVGKETCPDTGKVHMQGWIQFKRSVRMGQVKAALGSRVIHVEPCKGSTLANEDYCKKEGCFESYGEFIGQGRRSDLLAIRDEMLAGASWYDILFNHFETYCRYRGGIRDFYQMVVKKRGREWRTVNVEVLEGLTGVGKTKAAMAEDPDAYKISGSSLDWWDGYDGEKTIVIDEYANDVKITKLMGILDGYQLRLPTKGSFTYALWDRVIITTNYPWEQWHTNADPRHRDALKRRITKWTHVESEDEEKASELPEDFVFSPAPVGEVAKASAAAHARAVAAEKVSVRAMGRIALIARVFALRNLN